MSSNELCTFQRRLLILAQAYELLLQCGYGVLDQLVFHLYYLWCWSGVHVLSTQQWLQFSLSLKPNGRMYYQNDFVCLHLLPSPEAIEWRQFFWPCGMHESHLITPVNAVNRHSCLQHYFSTTDIVSLRSLTETSKETFIEFCGGNS